MRLIRTLLLLLAILLALLGLVIAAAFLPPVQTWIFQTRVLDRIAADYPGLHGSVDSVSAGLTSIELTNLKLDRNGIVLTAPDVVAELPLKNALFDKQFLIRRLTAKGWTLALGPQPVPVTYAEDGTAIPASATPTSSASTKPPATASSAAASSTPMGTPTTAAEETAHRLQRLLTGWQLPFDGSVASADVEGDVLIPPRAGNEPLPLHLVAKGGGLVAGQTANFAVTGSAPTGYLALPMVNVDGKVALTFNTGRALDRFTFDGTVAPAGHSRGVTIALTLGDLASGAAPTVQFAASRNDRRLAVVNGQLSTDMARIAGTWRTDLRESEILRLWPDVPIRLADVAGEGRFEGDVDLTAVHLAGKLTSTNPELRALTPALARLGPIVIGATFDATHTAGALRVDQLDLKIVREAEPPAVAVVGTPQPTSGAAAGGRQLVLATVTAKQPFTITAAHAVPTKPNADWLDIDLRDCPLTLLPRLPGGVRFTAGNATGAFTVMAVTGGYGVRANGPITANGVTLRRGANTVASGLDVAVTLHADDTPDHGWVVRAEPLTVSHAGHELATVTAKVPLRRDEYGRIPVTGSWKMDFDAVKDVLGSGFAEGFNAREGSGDFTANIGTAADLMAKVNLTGHDPAHTVSATINGSLDDYQSATFEIPIKIAFGADTSQITISGTWVMGADGPHVDLQVASARVAIEQLKWAAEVVPALRAALAEPRPRDAAAAALTEQHSPDHGTVEPADRVSGAVAARTSSDGSPVRAERPFWGNITGRIRFDIQQVIAGKREWDQLGGTIELQPTTLALHGGRIVYNPVSAAKFDAAHLGERTVEPHSAVAGEGTLTFDPAATQPYQFKGAGTVDGVNIAHFLAPVHEGEQPTIEGHFAVADTITSAGADLADVFNHRHEAYRLTSDAGIVRILKTNVAAALPNPPTPVSDAVAGVGSAVSALFGHKVGGSVKVDPRTDAVLNFSYDVAEIGFDHFTATAARQSDGSFRLSDIDIRSAHEHLTGGGAMADAALPVASRPLTLELTLAVKGISGDRLAKAGLLGPDKDGLGYAVVRDPIHVGGTLNQVDNTAWRDLLARAITAPPPQR